MRLKSLKYSLLNIILTGVAFGFPPAQADNAPRPLTIHDVDFKSYYLAQPDYGLCYKFVKDICNDRTDTDFCPYGLSISVSYIDSAADAPPLAIVKGSSCFAGTNGPDVLDLFMADDKGQVVRIALPRPDPKLAGALFGSTQSDFLWESNQLVQRVSDSTGRDSPLVVRYFWKGNHLSIASVEAAPSYRTSYDCATATEEHDRAVCYIEGLAALDLRLAAAYEAAQASNPRERKSLLRAEQRAWRAGRDAECSMQRLWVKCMYDKYTRRIAELDARH